MSDVASTRPTRRLRKALLFLAIAFVLLVMFVALAGPALIAAVAPAVARNIGIPGRLELEHVSLSWSGDLAVERASLYDVDGEHIASVAVNTGGGLLGLLDAHIEQDIVVDGWASVRMLEDGATNIERALGLERSDEPTAEAPKERDPIELPFGRVQLQGLDLAVTRAGSPTVAISGLEGQAVADGARIDADVRGTLVSPRAHPASRAEIAEATLAGRFEIEADVDVSDLKGEARASIAELTPEFARSLGALSGDEVLAESAMVAAQGGLGLEVVASLESGLPRQASISLESQTVRASLAVSQRDGAIQLESPGSVNIDTSAFLAREAIRRVAVPTQGVQVVRAGNLSLNIEQLVVPMDGATPELAQLRADLRATLQPSQLQVPGAGGADAIISLSQIALRTSIEPSELIRLDATARAAINDQPEGAFSFEARADGDALVRMLSGGFEASVGSLTGVVPSIDVSLERMPVLAAKPWLARLENIGLDLPEITGPVLDATIGWKANEDNSASIVVALDAAHLRASADARWTEEAIVLTTPAMLGVDRPNAIAAAWLPEGWSMENGQGIQARVSDFRLPMADLSPQVANTAIVAELTASGPTLTPADGPNLIISDLRLNVQADGASTKVNLAATPVIAEDTAVLSAELRSNGLERMLGGDQIELPQATGEITLQAPTRLVRAFEMEAAGRPLEAWLGDAVGSDVRLSLKLTEPTASDLLAGVLEVEAQHARLEATGLRASTSRASIDAATLRMTPSAQLWKGVAPKIGMEGSSLARTAPLVATVGDATLEFGQGLNISDGLDQTTLSMSLEDAIRLDGVPTGAAAEGEERQRTSVVLTSLRGSVNSLGRALSGRADLEATLDLAVESPELGRIAVVNANATSNQTGDLDARVTIDEVSVRQTLALAGVGVGGLDAAAGSIGESGRIVINARAAATPQAALPWTPRRVSIGLNTPRLATSQAIVANFTTNTIELAQPTTVTWTPDASWLATAIGAQVTAVQPFKIRLDQVALGNPLAQGQGLLDPARVALDASLDAKGATIAIPERPSINLDSLTGRVRRVARSTYGITANASTTGGGTLELNGLVQNPADAQGRLDLETAEVRGTLKGDDVPVALADALSNTNGLLADSLGPVVDLDAEIQHGRLIPGQPPAADLRFSVRGPRADASGYGRLENHRIIMAEPQTILTVREVRPEITERFSELIPELLMVEKRPEDGPAIIRTQGLTIPTNGEWEHGQGEVTIALGTARFRTSSVLSSVLKATGQRAEGSLGRRIEPIQVSMVDGVITYQPFTLPLGDLELESEGTVNLVESTMDVIVWIPKAALTDAAAGRFNTGLGTALGRTVPGFSKVTTVPWRVSGELSSPSIRPAPQVLIKRRGSEFLGPLLNPGESLQDLLSLPGGKSGQSGGG
ncbi:hypothetical protein AY599_08520 [Leptolyngbya valderiana BDU 20041]|nr:hypothetical protein AY599_08520 [Leptolyngbya valderiana BDU 20041]